VSALGNEVSYTREVELPLYNAIRARTIEEAQDNILVLQTNMDERGMVCDGCLTGKGKKIDLWRGQIEDNLKILMTPSQTDLEAYTTLKMVQESLRLDCKDPGDKVGDMEGYPGANKNIGALLIGILTAIMWMIILWRTPSPIRSNSQ